jgi:hypothetical protein
MTWARAQAGSHSISARHHAIAGAFPILAPAGEGDQTGIARPGARQLPVWESQSKAGRQVLVRRVAISLMGVMPLLAACAAGSGTATLTAPRHKPTRTRPHRPVDPAPAALGRSRRGSSTHTYGSLGTAVRRTGAAARACTGARKPSACARRRACRKAVCHEDHIAAELLRDPFQAEAVLYAMTKDFVCAGRGDRMEIRS